MRKVILMISIVAVFIINVYFFNFLQIYTKTISYFAVIFNKSQSINYILNVLDIALHNSDDTEENENTVLSFLIPILIILLLAIGYIINKKNKPINPNAQLTKNEPYLLALKIRSSLMQIDSVYKTGELDELIYSVKCLEEKLYIDSDFGYGSNEVIGCENNIASQLQYLMDAVPNIMLGDMFDNIGKLNIVIININSLLQRRNELKKK